MNQILSNTIEIIRTQRNEYLNEASITSLINGILYSYGWNVFNPREVAPEYNIYSEKHPKRVDLALKLFGLRKIFIEIKDQKKGKNLKKHEKQLKGYLNKTPDVKLGILTNASSWWFYNSTKDENFHIKIIEGPKLDIIRDSNSKIENIFSDYLSRKKMADEWFNTYMDILFSDNYHYSEKQTAILNLKKMKDKRLLEPFKRVLNDQEDNITRRTAFDGIIELSEEKDLKPLLIKSLNDKSPEIKMKAVEQLEKMKKQEELKLQNYKSDLGIQ